MLTDWKNSGAALVPIIDRSPSLKEVKPLASNLSALGEAGLETLSYLKTGAAPTAEWRTMALAKMDEAAKPYAALEIAVVPSIRRLILATDK
jgi:hypothetical protein